MSLFCHRLRSTSISLFPSKSLTPHYCFESVTTAKTKMLGPQLTTTSEITVASLPTGSYLLL